MSYLKISRLEQFRIKAKILLKSLKNENFSDKNESAQRFKIIPELNKLVIDEIISGKDNLKLKHALRVIAMENGFSGWNEFKASLDKNNPAKNKKLISDRKDANIVKEFDRQLNNLLEKGYDKLSGLTQTEFLSHVLPLKEKLLKLKLNTSIKDNEINFVIVIKNSLISTEQAMPLIIRKNKSAFIKMNPNHPDDFKPISGLNIPDTLAYLLLDINRGDETLNIRPKDAFELIKTQQRSPLTIDEGIAVLTHYPDFLQKNKCFYLLGSRRNDLKIPALWLSGGSPKLGWCWNGNLHTWLGSASCKARV